MSEQETDEWTAFCQSVEKCSHEELVRILRDLCATDEHVLKVVSKQLSREQAKGAGCAVTGQEKATQHSNSKKRKATDEIPKKLESSNVEDEDLSFKDRYKHCVNCYELFDLLNPTGVCRYHAEELEVNDEDDFWADHDEDCHGEIDSDFCRLEYPQGFLWNCCDQAGDAKGCRTSSHEAGLNLSEYAKLVRVGMKTGQA